MTPQAFQALLVAIVVSIDVHEFFERFASFRKIALPRINVEKFEQGLKVLRFAVELVVDGRPKFQEGLRLQVLPRHRVQVRGKFILVFAREHALLEGLQQLDGLRILARGSVVIGQIE